MLTHFVKLTDSVSSMMNLPHFSCEGFKAILLTPTHTKEKTSFSYLVQQKMKEASSIVITMTALATITAAIRINVVLSANKNTALL